MKTDVDAKIDIAIIDSGINPQHPHIRNVSGGCSFSIDEHGNVVEGVDYIDVIGHGTAVAGVIYGKAPHSEVYAVKIFQQELKTEISCLLAALEWAISRQIKVIHLSLGLEGDENRRLLEPLCQTAIDNNLILVASARTRDDQVCPAVLGSVIGVHWEKSCSEDQFIYNEDSPIEFGAYGYPRPLPGRPAHLNYQGSSFAAARLTGEIANLLHEHPEADISRIRKLLANQASTAV